ncbi:hypothetical protein FE257_006386 [Aspergillus nanangensis]|uniref:DNA replication checkpoint mediator MRC1 domain-containing protein n=1 Tax=Aspergillus nanangensis TaxID=2582783 RepID=A0AAD4CXY0_ASPNN|nr:hypothetical protein FE257_006386 [Aspergillus nanangensis]
MTAPSTPRSTRSASPTADSPAMLTPGRKIKALMAAFDSDSDSDKEPSKHLKTSAELFSDTAKNNPPTDLDQPRLTLDADASEDEDEDEIVMPKGRMAARMQGQMQNHGTTENLNPETSSAFERVSKTLHSKNGHPEPTNVLTSDKELSSDDDLPAAGPRRRFTNSKNTTARGSDRSPSPAARAFSPLFMSSPTAHQNGNGGQGSDRDDSDNDDEPQPKSNARFLALVAQKRKEREERDRAEAEKKSERAKLREQLSSEMQIDSGEDSADGDSGRKLSKQARPPRKASKKALEEMYRETQRMSRSMQLAHQAQTKKKITKESLFARFNFMQPNPQPTDSSSVAADSQQSSDAEAAKAKETPQTSPVVGPSDKPSTDEGVVNELQKGAVPEFPTLEQMVNGAQQQPDQVTVAHVAVQENGNTPPKSMAVPAEKKTMTGPSVRVRLTRKQVAENQEDDSDTDLEVVTSPAKCRRLAAFENHSTKRTQESQAMLKLKTLAHLTSPTRKTGMSTAELSAQLLHQARQQATQERKKRIEELRAKGMVIETAEERIAMEDDLENLVEKARKEAEEIAKMERKRSKNGEDDDDDDEDDDYELSDSEGGEELDNKEEDDDDKGENVFDSEAGEGEDSEDDQTEAMSSEETEVPTQRRKRPNRVISDDEDEEDQEPKTPAKPIVSAVNSVERPHIPMSPSNGMTMSLTQAFAGTLAGQDSQEGPSTIPISLPDPAGNMADDHQEPDSQMVIKDSQEQRLETPEFLAGYAQSDARVSESPGPRTLSQFSQAPEPTQDAGFQFSPFDPSKRFLGTPTSTIETVLVNRDDSWNNSPIPDKKSKRLRRGREAELSVIEEQEEGDFEIDASAFDVMKKAVKKPSVPFDKMKSKAKDVIEEAAEESDDEYAGLGGASEDEDDEENAYDRQMINDNSGETVDEKQLAALNALQERNADEKQVAKLLKDITTGALRRRRNATDEFDLDDSDDELLARRREKQREFARMRRALLADEKIGEIAENPKKAAFFKAVEDREMDDDADLDFLDFEEAPGSQGDTSSQDVGSDAQEHTADGENNKRKRPLEPSAEDIHNRPPPHLRRKPASAMSKKPTTLAEIRESVSFLTERPEYDSFHEDASMEEDDDGVQGDAEDDDAAVREEESPAPVHPRRTRGPVVDRLALLRQASSNSASSGSNTRVAFHAGSRADHAANVGFRAPPQLRRTSTSSSTSSMSSKSDSSRRVAAPGGPMAKKGAVNYYTAAREKERERELRIKQRSSGSNITALLGKHASNRLGALERKGQWD